MSLEAWIESAAWVVTAFLLWKFTPRHRMREAQVSFMFMQIPAWFLGMLVVELGMLEYPVRFFDDSTRTSFTFEFFILPAVSVLFNLHFPSSGSRWKKLGYVLAFPTAITIMEYPIELHTRLIEYVYWHWSVTWGSLLLVLYCSYLYFRWFFPQR